MSKLWCAIFHMKHHYMVQRYAIRLSHWACRKCGREWISTMRIVGLLLLCTHCSASVITPEFVHWVGMRESGMNHRAVGRHGEVGAYQLKPIALRDVNKNFGWRYTVADLRDPSPARAVATAFLGLQERRLLGYLRRQPSTSEIYSAYRYGFAGWKRRTGR